MPPKIRELKKWLSQAGFDLQKDRGRGSHTLWRHPAFPAVTVVVSGRDGDDAHEYQVKHVERAISDTKRDVDPAVGQERKDGQP